MPIETWKREETTAVTVKNKRRTIRLGFGGQPSQFEVCEGGRMRAEAKVHE